MAVSHSLGSFLHRNYSCTEVLLYFCSTCRYHLNATTLLFRRAPAPAPRGTILLNLELVLIRIGRTVKMAGRFIDRSVGAYFSGPPCILSVMILLTCSNWSLPTALSDVLG